MGELGKRPEAVDGTSMTRIVDGLPHAAALLTAAGDVAHENAAFRSLRLGAALPHVGFLAALGHAAGAGLAQAEADDAEVQIRGASGVTHRATLTRLMFNDAGAGFLCQVVDNAAAPDTRLSYLMDHLVQGVWDYDLRSGVFTASKAWRQLRGLPPDHLVDMSNTDWLDRVHPEDREALERAFHDLKDGAAPSVVIQYRHVHKSGHWVWILCRASVVEHDEGGRPLRIIGTDTDISQAMQNQEAINQLASKLTLAVEASGMGIWEFNPETGQVHWDDRMLEIYGITDGQNIRSENLWATYLHPDDYESAVAYAEECKALNRDFKRDYRIVRPSGKIRYIRSLARTVDIPNAPSKLIGVNVDVTEDYQRAQELEAARAKLEHDALHDELTGLGNRRALDKYASALFNRVGSDDRYAVLQIDLDHFKEVNDTLGHSAGDFVLRQVGRSLRDGVAPNGQAFRVGGDEFSVLFEEAPEPEVLNGICERLIETLSAPRTFEGQACAIGASIGYAIGVGPPESHSAIFIDADTALYAAKRAGRFTYRAYTEAIGKGFHVVPNARSDLQNALNDDEIVFFLQPQYDVETLEVVGAEALVRWRSPTNGLLAPDEFLGSAADAGLLGAIDRHVFLRVLELQTSWYHQGLAYPRISVNISRTRFEDERMLAQTFEVLEPHHRFGFELLETTFYDTPSAEVLQRLEALRDAGIEIAMDDFGTGYASVRALQALKPDTVKIDRSLVAPLDARPEQVEVLQNLSKIARLEGAKVVLEGLETAAQMVAIRKLDCDVLQGFALQRPISEVEFTASLRGRAARVSTA